MTTIGYDSIENILLSISDPNTWGAMTQVPWVSSPKINWATSVYNVEWGTGIAWWSTNISWSSSDFNTVAWTSWSIYLPDWTALAVTSWNTGDMSTTTYIYYDREDNTIKTTTSASASVWEKKILLCVASPTVSWKDAEFQAFGCGDQSSFIYADNIAANSITGNEIAANTITWGKIQWGTITANKLDVDELSAITADLWSITAWDIKGTTITAGNTNSAAIKLYPSTSSQWMLEFYYWGNVVWYIYWDNVWAAWGNLVRIHSWNTILLDWDVYVLYRNVLDLSAWKLKIPVWTNLY